MSHDEPMSHAEEVDLVRRVLRGEPGAADAFIRKTSTVLRRTILWALRRYGPRFIESQVIDLVDDLTHDFYVKKILARRGMLHTWDEVRPLSPYLCKSAKNLVIDEIRGRIRRWRWERPPHDERVWEVVATLDLDPEDVGVRKDFVERVVAIFKEEVTGARWEMYQRLYVRWMTMEEIARATGKSCDAVYKDASRIRQDLRNIAARLSGPDNDDPDLEGPGDTPPEDAPGAADDEADEDAP